MLKSRNRLGIISALLLVLWLAAVISHLPERSVELFPLMALVAGLVEVARAQQRRGVECLQTRQLNSMEIHL